MFLTSKIGWAGLALALLTAGMLVRDSPRSKAGSDSNKDGAADFVIRNEITKLQETLRDKGHYRSKIDGVFGLRTRDSIREYQKAENLPLTGQVDTRTAGGLGVRPESTWVKSENAKQEPGYSNNQAGDDVNRDKPSAGIPWADGRAGKTRRTKVSRTPTVGDNREDAANKRLSDNGKLDQ